MGARTLRAATGRAPLVPVSAAPGPTPPPADRGKMLYVDDIVALLGTRPDGKPRRSAWWVRTQFAQSQRRKLGRTPYWWEADVRAELQTMTATGEEG